MANFYTDNPDLRQHLSPFDGEDRCAQRARLCRRFEI